MLLAEFGHRVLLVEQRAFPSDTMSTLYIHQPGVARLRDWGVLPTLLEAGCPRLASLSHTIGPVTVSGPVPAHDGVDFAIAPRRHLLDHAMAGAAEEAGAEFRSRTKLVDLMRRGGRVVGVLLRNPDGSLSEEHCRVVIGADGMRSSVARLCGAPKTVDHARRTCVYYSGWRVGGEHVRLVESEGRYLGVIPTNDGVSLIATYAPQSEFERIRTDPSRFHREVIGALTPDLAERLPTAEPVLGLVGTGDQQNFFRRASGPGWALVGDAGHHKDSITARGITDAFLQAEVLAQSLAGRCGTEEVVDAALAEFGRRRDGLLMETYTATIATTRLQVSERRLDNHERIRRTPGLTETYLGVLAGIRPPEELVGNTPEPDAEQPVERREAT
jgi:2-polyprenyl-6-methoxyphenol hydroxylase-like FAD-dependent oxidoreductase